MKPWLKIVLTIVITGGVVGGITYYFVNKNATADKNNLQSQIDDLNKKLSDAKTALTTAQTVASSTSNSSISSTSTSVADSATTSTTWKNYSNTAYGFSMTFPNDNWKGYKTAEKTPSGNTKSIYFCVKTTGNSWKDSVCEDGYYSIVAVGVYTKAQWNVVASEDTPESESKIAENSNYVFTLAHAQDVPDDLVNVNFNTDALTSSFKAN